jgi:hypothetical protein
LSGVFVRFRVRRFRQKLLIKGEMSTDLTTAVFTNLFMATDVTQIRAVPGIFPAAHAAARLQQVDLPWPPPGA